MVHLGLLGLLEALEAGHQKVDTKNPSFEPEIRFEERWVGDRSQSEEVILREGIDYRYLVGDTSNPYSTAKLLALNGAARLQTNVLSMVLLADSSLC